MSRVCVATASPKAYFTVASKLRSAGLPFVSLLPSQLTGECELVLTTRAESVGLGGRVLCIEDLSDDPDIVRGQVYASSLGESKKLVVGIDPGRRSGLVAFYGDRELFSKTFNSAGDVCACLREVVFKIPSSGLTVRIGNGDRVFAGRLAREISMAVPLARVEIVDESGTSERGVSTRGLPSDQGAAARIAARKGTPF